LKTIITPNKPGVLKRGQIKGPLDKKPPGGEKRGKPPPRGDTHKTGEIKKGPKERPKQGAWEKQRCSPRKRGPFLRAH